MHYPIWHKVQACHYKSNKSWGGKNDSVDNIVVGSSSSNSYNIAKTRTTRRFKEIDGKEYCIFKFSVDDIVLKEVWFKNNNGKTGEYIKTISYLNEKVVS